MTQYYQKAIDLLVQGNVDFKQVAVQLAKEYPDLFVKYATPIRVETWEQEVIHFIRRKMKVDAVKTLRANTGFGLRDALDVVLYLQNRLGLAENDLNKHLSDAQYDVYQRLFDIAEKT